MAKADAQKFLGRLRSLFGDLDHPEPQAALAEYINALTGQTEGTLQAAADILAREHRIRTWPTVAECLDAVNLAKRRVTHAAVGLTPIDNFDSWWAENMARIRTASTQGQIDKVIKEIEPYAFARWIASHRLPDALAEAAAVSSKWKAASASDVTQRILGEAD